MKIRLATWFSVRPGRELLELVVLDRPQGPAVLHAMRMRAKYRTLLTRRS